MKNEVVNILMEKVRKILKSKQIPFEEYSEEHIDILHLLNNDGTKTKAFCKFSDTGCCFVSGLVPSAFTSYLFWTIYEDNIDEKLCDIIGSFVNLDIEINGMRPISLPDSKKYWKEVKEKQ